MKFFSQLMSLTAPPISTEGEQETTNTRQETLEKLFSTDAFYTALLTYGIAMHPYSCTDKPLDETRREEYLSRHISSIGKYHKGPYLSCEYGLGSESVQAFCRSVAVHGGTTVLNGSFEEQGVHSKETVQVDSERFRVRIQESDDERTVAVNDEVIGKVKKVIRVSGTR